MTKCNSTVTALDIRDFPIDTLEKLPDYILAERDIIDPTTDDLIGTLVRVPSEKLFPNGNYDNIFPLDANNTAITIPANQVRACRIAAVGNTGVIQYADASHPAQFLALGTQADQIVCQNSGVVNIIGIHSYILGAQYYTGANGVPTTDSASGQKLFIPISNTKLLINL